MKKYALLSLTLMLIGLPSYALAEVNFGYLANRGDLKAKEEWTDLMEDLSKSVGQEVNLVALSIEKAADSIGKKEVDFLLSNSVITAIVMEQDKAKLLATVDSGKGAEFGGVILANKNSGITKSADLKGKKVMSYGTDSAGAYVFQVYHLKQKGVDVKKDLASFVQAKKQDDIPMAVKSGLFDAGFVRTGVLESMQKKGLLKVDDFVIVDKVADSGAEVRTTALYPEWCLVARADTDPAIVEKIKTAVLALKSDNPAVQKATIKGFIEPRDMGPLIKMLKELKVAPFDK
ncbi:MAG: phosphate/phosphite/phosphonate ABC transporter substrate-binding protein [Alphaproteobacteria bacterium]|nr:phosphate/phosphite/phosphonate ABC transporter substrate-binding protein [Alphaproteobacteria bacterium]